MEYKHGDFTLDDFKRLLNELFKDRKTIHWPSFSAMSAASKELLDKAFKEEAKKFIRSNNEDKTNKGNLS